MRLCFNLLPSTLGVLKHYPPEVRLQSLTQQADDRRPARPSSVASLFHRISAPTSGACQCKPWITTVTNITEKAYIEKLLANYGNSNNIKRIENPYLWARYVLRYEELNAADGDHEVNERIVIHATSSENASKIAEENFDWRLSERCRFGRGVSFSTAASYANKYSSQEEIFIIAGILVGESTVGDYDTRIPPCGYDTTGDERGRVFIKYYDNDFYPYYIVENKEHQEFLALLMS